MFLRELSPNHALGGRRSWPKTLIGAMLSESQFFGCSGVSIRKVDKHLCGQAETIINPARSIASR
jgi:hypothetical protein